jgi:hypothetical protein
MAGSVIYHQRRGETKNMPSSDIALLIALFVALICMFIRFVYQYPTYTKNIEERENEFYQ